MNYIRKITIVGLLIISLVLELTPIVQLSNAQQVVFRVGWGGTSFDTFNPFTTYTMISTWATLNVYSRLVRPTINYTSYVPDLAESWSIIGEDVIRFSLVKNATFHDGKPVTAYDVEYSFYLANQSWSTRAPNVKTIRSMRIIDEYTIEFNVTSIPLFLSQAASTITIVPKHIWANISDPSTYNAYPPIGSGPLRVVDYKEGQYIVLEPYSNFYYPWMLPKVSRIIIKLYPDVTSATNALLAGDIDAVGPYIPMALYDTLANNPQFKVFKSPGVMYFYIAFNVDPEGTGNPTLKDKAVRLALAHATNVSYVCDVAWHGYSKPIASVVPTSNMFYNWNLKLYEYNLTLASKILEDAGYKLGSKGVRVSPDGIELRYTILVPSKFPEAVNAAQLIANMWRQIGVYAEVKAMDTGSMSAIIWQNKDGKTILGHDIDLWDWNVGPDDVTIFDVFVTGRKLTGTSDSGYSNPEYDELYEKLFEAKTFNELLSIAYKLQEILYNDLPYINLCEVEPIQAHNTKFTGFNYDWPGGPFGGNDWTTFLNVRLAETSSITPQQVESTLQAPVAQTSDQTMMLALIAVVVATVAVVAGYLLVTRRR
ncbi:MAG: ABC transporter substrate-binding protein [Desulfurococcaceae archaeon]